MPLYEYQCEDCRALFEKLVRAWGEKVACPECHGSAVSRRLSTFAVAIAGGGTLSAGGGCGCGRGGCGCGH